MRSAEVHAVGKYTQSDMFNTFAPRKVSFSPKLFSESSQGNKEQGGSLNILLVRSIDAVIDFKADFEVIDGR